MRGNNSIRRALADVAGLMCQFEGQLLIQISMGGNSAFLLSETMCVAHDLFIIRYEGMLWLSSNVTFQYSIVFVSTQEKGAKEQ